MLGGNLGSLLYGDVSVMISIIDTAASKLKVSVIPLYDF